MNMKLAMWQQYLRDRLNPAQVGAELSPQTEHFQSDLIGLQCGAKTRAGKPCKQQAIYASGRCKWHGGCSTGPKSSAGKKRSAMNGLCPKKKRTHSEVRLWQGSRLFCA